MSRRRSPGHAITMRVEAPAGYTATSDLTGCAASAGAEITALDVIESTPERVVHRRDELLTARADQRAQASAKGGLDFRADTRHVRESDWTVAPPPAALRDRRVEMTGPATPAKMAINALNSGAKVWLADLEDASCPTWANVIDALLNLRDGALGTLQVTSADGKEYALRTDAPLAVVVTRPRGWHMDETHVLVDGARGLKGTGLAADQQRNRSHRHRTDRDQGTGRHTARRRSGAPPWRGPGGGLRTALPARTGPDCLLVSGCAVRRLPHPDGVRAGELTDDVPGGHGH